MADAALRLKEFGVDGVIGELCNDPISFLQTFNFIGSITAWHLAKNLGCDVAKPDRHLVRIASQFGYQSVHDLCNDLSCEFEEKVSVIDLVLWRYAVSGRDRPRLN